MEKNLIKSSYKIPGMDCPSEERIIRMKLEGKYEIKKLGFDLSNRTLDVFHTGSTPEITASLDSLGMGAKWVSSAECEMIMEDSNHQQKRVLWAVLLINFGFFLVEMITGLLSRSMGLVADSLDMLADAVVYGLSLMVVGRSVLKKKRVALVSGYFQMALAIIGLYEVIRRFTGHAPPPDYLAMILVSTFALAGNTVSLILLQKTSREEAHMRASWIFTSNDVLANIGVIVAGVLVLVTQSDRPDLVIGIIVFGLVIKGAFRILQLAK